MVVSQGDKLLVGLHVTEYWMLIGRGRGVGYNRETNASTHSDRSQTTARPQLSTAEQKDTGETIAPTEVLVYFFCNPV